MLAGAGDQRTRGAKAPSGGWSVKRALLHCRAWATVPRTDPLTVQSFRPGEVGCTLLVAGPVSRGRRELPGSPAPPRGGPRARVATLPLAGKGPSQSLSLDAPGPSLACLAGHCSGTSLPTSLTLPPGRPTVQRQGWAWCAKSATSCAPQTMRGAAAEPSARAGRRHLSGPGRGRHLARCNRPLPEGSCPRVLLRLEAVVCWSGSPSALHRLPAFSPRMQSKEEEVWEVPRPLGRTGLGLPDWRCKSPAKSRSLGPGTLWRLRAPSPASARAPSAPCGPQLCLRCASAAA